MHCAGSERGGLFGLFQPVADGLNLLVKERLPSGANRYVILAPMLTFILAPRLGGNPFDAGWVLADINVGVFYPFAIWSWACTAS